MTTTRIDLDDIIFEDHHIESDTTGITLYVRNKRSRSVSQFGPDRTIVMVHGATFSSGSLYDVRLGGMSYMDYLAAKGFDVFAVDVRGYGHSTRPSEMEQDGKLSPPVVKTDTGVADLASAVDFVLRHRGLDRVNIFGMSWGGTVAGAFVADNPDKVVKLALLAPQWLSDKPIPIDAGGELDSYRLVPVLEAKARWLSTAPEYARDSLVPDGWFETWADATLAEDPWSREKAPDRLRASNGPIQDIRDYWRAGRPFYDPSRIAAPVLLVHGEWDVDVTIDLALAFFQKLIAAPYRRWVEIGEATHLVLMEKNRIQAFDAIASFFFEDYTPE
ncbi:alpha/beta hydrolase (plasmid) [Rhizobium leguminosarum]|nr:alpha/beta hydrolase [Rhizobium leguminosarum]UIK14652.1 alpha/beta hydrolase [Rhizobium leguminosarum]UIL31568.1 alpha/beta hydrolase [Rhizobium leguminosarum]